MHLKNNQGQYAVIESLAERIFQFLLENPLPDERLDET
jgi:hypothetical protein